MATAPFAAPLFVPRTRLFNAAGAPLSGGQIESYVAGTSTPLATYPTYADALAGTNANANPVVLDASGEAAIFLTNTLYKIIAKDSGGTTQWTMDSVGPALGFPQPYLTEWVDETNPIVYVSATSFTVTGVDVTANYTFARRVKTVNTGGTVYSTVTSSSFAVNTTVNLTNDGAASLDAGLSSAAFGLLSYLNQSFQSPRTALTLIKNGNQAAFAASTKIATWTSQLDFNTEWDAANNRWICRYPGAYLVQLSVEAADTGTNQVITPQIAKNGTVIAQGVSRTSATASQIWSYSAHDIIYCYAVGDYIEAFLVGTANTTVQGTAGTRLTITRVQ